MTKDNWIAVAMIIAVIMTAAATALGPVLAVLVEWYINQPRPTPKVRKATRRTPETRASLVFWQFVKLRWRRLLLIFLINQFPSYVFFQAIRNPVPVNSRSALVISFAVVVWVGTIVWSSISGYYFALSGS